MARERIPVIDECTLDERELSDRVDEWRDLAASVTSTIATGDGVRMTLPVDPALASRAAELAALEQGCCGGVLRFGIDVGPSAVALTVWGSGASTLVEAMGLQVGSSATTSR